MPDTEKTLPEKVIEASEAFTKTLEMENAVVRNQLDGVIKSTIDALQQLITLCKEAVAVGNDAIDVAAQQTFTGTIQQALADVKQTTAQAPKTVTPVLPETVPGKTPTEPDLDSALVHAVGLSYENAVNTQQQVNITQQAAATMLISTLISVVTAALSVAVKKAES
ncbi:RebB family R body protein [Mucilaginibacter flavidus]|uniref:RebB family R body protein n=1 Tax=Mucilaginibacter flavidus TaxID=2949309 RepID=UPI0020933486|nr:RebB family R body protein [Mucilaginibacter flavidus]MCO5946149.1 RebB family R body protein [Mucilaginibacter flavidus]